MELFIYGEIGTEIVSKEINEQIRRASGSLIIRINSYGGDVFHAVAIHNALIDRGNVEVRIDGVCASAATIIALGGEKILMPENARFMIHDPSSILIGYYDIQRLNRIIRGLESVQESILGIYQNRTKLEYTRLTELMKEETWMNAEEAKKLGFIDEIIEPVEDVQASIAQKAVAEERARVRRLESYETQSIAAKAIISIAKANGKTLEEIEPYLNAIHKMESDRKNPLESQIADYLTSGAETVAGTAISAKKTAIDAVAKFANQGR